MTEPISHVFLFSGHMMDRPDRTAPRFPAAMEAAAAAAIDAALAHHGARPGDRALSQAAAGGDILFLEACQRRGLRCHVLLPFERVRFLDMSVRPSADGDRWVERFSRVIDGPDTTLEEMPVALGRSAEDTDPYERCNLWLLDRAMPGPDERLCFICLWNGDGPEGPGGTAHMVEAVRQRHGTVEHIDTRMLAVPKDGHA
jgi:hypothetical protein